MAKDLVIVESPAKARTLGRFLGSKYTTKASMGHVRDLPRGEMGVKVDDRSFKPTYRVPADKRKVVSEIKAASEAADTVYLATDPDREGEAISWHLVNAAKIDESKLKRVVFHEITREAVQEAFEHPRTIDTDLVDAQQARRVLDRLVGYELSPVLWKKVRRGLSAGRVQSVTLRLIVDREREIHAFVTREYWTVDAMLAKRPKDGKASSFKAALRAVKGESGNIKIADANEAHRITDDLEGASFSVESVKRREGRNPPSPPFITSTLQQEAWRKLRFTAARTMAVAQQLYEGLSAGDEGAVGLITYMRTDSTNVAVSAVQEVREYIGRAFGESYVPKSPRVYTKKARGAQEAHEAIRPTSMAREPDSLKGDLNRDQMRLYGLIWRRMLASQMADALLDRTTVDIDAASAQSAAHYSFRAQGQVLKFPGFRAVYMEDRDDSKDDSDEPSQLPELVVDEPLDCSKVAPEQHFTEPPPRYSEATLVKALEEKGIGRPSTYAPTIATVLNRDYASKDGGRFVPSKLGTAVSDLLIAHFPNIMDVGFTARVEEELDEIAAGERQWVPVLEEFYDPFSRSVEVAIRDAERVPRQLIDEETDEVCEKCERPMVIKSGRYGKFLSCSGFPECRNSRPLLNRVGVKCPQCGDGDLVERRQRGKRGRTFFGCTNYPNCDFAASRRPLPQPCPQCSGLLLASGRTNATCTKCEFKGPVPEDEPAEVAEAAV